MLIRLVRQISVPIRVINMEVNTDFTTDNGNNNTYTSFNGVLKVLEFNQMLVSCLYEHKFHIKKIFHDTHSNDTSHCAKYM